MAKRRQAAQVRQDQSFKGRQFTAEVILWARLAEGSVRRSRMEGQGEGVPWYLMFPISYRDLELMLQDRGVDSGGQTIDFLLSAKRDAEAAKRFFRKALAQPHTVNPRTITVDKNAAYPKAAAELKKDGELWRCSKLRQVKYLNNIVEQDHRRVKRLTGLGLAFGGFWAARRTLAGYEAMAMIRKGQVRNIGGRDIKAQARFIASLFEVAA
jgi:IS6 family transposase